MLKILLSRLQEDVSEEFPDVQARFRKAKESEIYKQGVKRVFRMGENNSKWSNWQTINLKNIQAAHAAQYQK